jgi:hypothetical protein
MPGSAMELQPIVPILSVMTLLYLRMSFWRIWYFQEKRSVNLQGTLHVGMLIKYLNTGKYECMRKLPRGLCECASYCLCLELGAHRSTQLEVSASLWQSDPCLWTWTPTDLPLILHDNLLTWISQKKSFIAVCLIITPNSELQFLICKIIVILLFPTSFIFFKHVEMSKWKFPEEIHG